jgi:hypothetical protein
MVEFEMTWMSERGSICTDTGRADIEEIRQWQEAIDRAAAANDEVTKITVPTRGDGEWSGSQVRAIMVKEIKPLHTRPAGW